MEIFGASASTQQHHLTESEVKREMKRIIWRRSYSEENLLGSVTRCPEVLFPNFAISYESCLIDDQFFIKSVPYHVLDASFSFFFFGQFPYCVIFDYRHGRKPLPACCIKDGQPLLSSSIHVTLFPLCLEPHEQQ